ncbi:MAG: hypothetical protein ACJ768_23380, partial [Gaiellaceae bacterium]
MDADAPAPAAVPVGSLRFSAPIRSITQSPTKNVSAPAVSPITTGTADGLHRISGHQPEPFDGLRGSRIGAQRVEDGLVLEQH